jgi:hypothetical protein
MEMLVLYIFMIAFIFLYWARFIRLRARLFFLFVLVVAVICVFSYLSRPGY